MRTKLFLLYTRHSVSEPPSHCYSNAVTDIRLAIPTVENGGNHTIAFAEAAASDAAHKAALDIIKALAATGVRVVDDDEFYAQARR